MASLKHLPLDSTLFGRRMGMVDVLDQQDVLPVAQLPFDEFDFVQAKVRSRNTRLVDDLSAAGFRLCEGEVDFEFHVDSKNSKPASASQSTFSSRLAEEKDIPTLSDLAASAFRGQTRFREPWFSNKEADLVYTTWIANSVRGKFDDVCLLVENAKGEVLGLVTLRSADGSDARVGLLAVRDTARKIGLGRFLVDTAKDWTAKQERPCLRIATQLSNLDAMRLYTRTGGMPIETSCWLYKNQGTNHM